MFKTEKEKTMRRKRKNREERQKEIWEGTIDLLQKKGYERITMAAIAARVKMSKETLYALFASKETLFSSLIRHNAAIVNEELEEASEKDVFSVIETLERFGERLIRLLTSREAIALNRTAIAALHADREFSQILFQKGRQTTLPLLKKVLARGIKNGELPEDIPEDAGELFLGLLMGDLQIRCLLGICELPNDQEVHERAQRAVRRFMILTKK